MPPLERRGLVLIDPPYEDIDELKTVLRAVADAHRRWPSAIFLVWYPILSAAQRRSVHARFAALRIPKMLSADLAIHADEANLGLAGSGLLIVNPPFGADEYLGAAYRGGTRLPVAVGRRIRGSRAPDPRTNGTMSASARRNASWTQSICAEQLSKLHTELAGAQPSIRRCANCCARSWTTSRALVDRPTSTGGGAADASIADRIEELAVRFEADHPALAANTRRLVDLLGKAGL